MRVRKYDTGSNILYSGLGNMSIKWEDWISQKLWPTPKIDNFPTLVSWGDSYKNLQLDYYKNNYQADREKQNKRASGNQVVAAGTSAATNYATDKLTDKLFDDSELGRGLGTLFSSGVSSAGNTLSDNLLKGTTLTEGLGINAGASVAGAGAGLTANYLGQGINSLGGNTMLSRGIGLGVATGLGTIGGAAMSNLVLYGTLAGKTADGAKTALIGKAAGAINPYALAMNVVGSGLGAAFGPSKEYSGRYGNITLTMDSVYDTAMVGANFIPGVGQMVSGVMALNKGLSNVFGSTDGMTKTDAILGSAFMPAPVKWLNMWGASSTGTFDRQSWQNLLKANSFMGDAFGNLSDKFDLARLEAGKTYGTFSQGAKRDAQRNINFANSAWGQIMDMANLNEYQNIRSQYMSSINNLRYAQAIQGGWTPLARGKLGMKILNNATNHNMGMRLLSAAALIDSKQMILSAQGGTKFGKRRFTKEEIEANKLKVYLLERESAERRSKANAKAAEKFNRTANTVMEAMTLQANETPFTGQEYLQAAEDLRQEKVEKFNEAEKIAEAAMMADLAVSAAPLLLRGFRWVFNKAGLLVKVPMLKTSYSVGLPGYPHYYNPTTNQWDFSSAASDVKQGIDNLREWMNNPVYRKAAEANKAEAEAMGLTYIPYYERPEYIRALENPNIKFKNLNSSVGGESNLSGEVTINTGTTLNPTLVVRHEMGHVAGLGKISESAAINPDNTLLLKELKYLRHKSNQVYKEGSEYAGQVDLNRNSFEGIQNARDFGEELGIKIGQEYPGYEKALETVNSYPENGFKAGLKKMFRLDKEHMPYVWKALAGTLFTLAATLYNTNK